MGLGHFSCSGLWSALFDPDLVFLLQFEDWWFILVDLALPQLYMPKLLTLHTQMRCFCQIWSFALPYLFWLSPMTQCSGCDSECIEMMWTMWGKYPSTKILILWRLMGHACPIRMLIFDIWKHFVVPHVMLVMPMWLEFEWGFLMMRLINSGTAGLWSVLSDPDFTFFTQIDPLQFPFVDYGLAKLPKHSFLILQLQRTCWCQFWYFVRVSPFLG